VTKITRLAGGDDIHVVSLSLAIRAKSTVPQPSGRQLNINHLHLLPWRLMERECSPPVFDFNRFN
jgi:hypothetical protein